ncbi:TPA: hypothetical protein ACGGHE_005311 [Bacillus pseudomycoides]
MLAMRPKRGDFYTHKKDSRVYQVLGYAKMFEQNEQDIIILKRMKDRVTITLSADLFILYINANKFLKNKEILNNLKVSL